MILDENSSRGSSRKVDSSHPPSLYRTPTKQLQGKKKNKKTSCLARLGTNWIHHQTHLSAARITTLTSLFKAHRKVWERSKVTTVMWVSSGQHHFPWLARQKYLKGSEHTVQQLMSLHWPPAAPHRRISPSYHTVLGSSWSQRYE